MQGKTKFDYEIKNFISAFQEKKDKKIVLYGTGRMTATLIDRIEGFHIIGLCDRDSNLIGRKMYGLPILGKDEVEQKADLVIINTSATYWRTIYYRIKNWNIPIYFLNGELAKEDANEDDKNPYWNKNYMELEQLIDQYDIVSFDIFDTLIMRKVMFPIDILHLTEKQINQKEKLKTDFISLRKKASAILVNPTLDEIYTKISEFTLRDPDTIEEWKQIEIDTEKKLLAARKDIIDLCKKAMETKTVFFISDMYYSTNTIQDFLAKIGLLVNQWQIIISSEYKKTKEEGTLWEYYKEKVIRKKKALHIGDNEISDIQNAEKYGISTYYIMNPYKMLESSSLKSLRSSIESLYSSIVGGVICAKIFNSPFSLNNTKGQIKFKNEVETGYCLLGGLLYSFMDWIIEKAKEDKVKKLLFFGREGYLLIPIYNYFKKIVKEEVPEAIYLEISRRAVWNASITNEEDIYDVAQFPYIGNLKQFLKERFGISIEEKNLSEISISEKQKDKKEIKKLLSGYEKKIIEKAKKERENYQAYFNSLNINEKYAVVDSQFYGSTQYYLSRILNKKLKGYYFCVCIDQDNYYLNNNEMYGCFQGTPEIQSKDTNVHKQAQFLESFFTSPNGMLEYIEDDGSKQYAEKMTNQKFFDTRIDMVEGIKEFIGELFAIQKELQISEKDPMWSDKLFGCFMNQGFIPSDKVKTSFYFDNRIISKKEMPIWD